MFATPLEHRDLLDRFARAFVDGGAECFAWAIMSNHFHAVVRSGHHPLSKVIHRLQTGFAITFNRRFERQGHVFQSRFQSRVAEDDSDVMGLIRYVHLNPLRAGIVSSLGELADYSWCGHGALVGRREPLAFESVSSALSFFGAEPKSARAALTDFMSRPADDQSDPLDRLVREVCLEAGVSVAELRDGNRNSPTTLARRVICKRAVEELRVRKLDIARAIGVTPAAVSQLLKREPPTF